MDSKNTVLTTSTFEKDVKRLSKKHRSLKSDLLKFIESLEENHEHKVQT